MVWWLSATLIAGVTQRPSVGFVFAVCALAGARWWGGGVRACASVGVLAALCLVYGLLVARGLSIERGCYLSALGPGVEVELEGTVSSFPRTYPYGTEFSFKTRLGPGRVRLRLRATRFDLHYGDRLRVRARAVRTHTPTRALFADGVVGVIRAGYADVDVVAHDGGACWRRPLWLLHRRARVTLSRALGARAALPLALLVGERGFVDRRTRDAFARLGTTHLLALSGMHLGIVAGLAWALLGIKGRDRRGMLAVLALGLCAYVGVVGGIHSLDRALAMALVLIAARLFERPASPLLALRQALFFLLASAPASLYSVGFQLSFAATLAVILTVTNLPRPAYHGRARRTLLNAAIAPVASAGVLIVVAPLQLRYFGVVSLMSPFATVALLPAIALLLVGAVLLAVAAPVPAIGPALCAALGWLSDATAGAAVVASRHAPDPLALPVPNVAVYCAGLVLAWSGRRHAWAIVVGTLACAGSFWWGVR